MAESIDTIQERQMQYLVAQLAALGYTLDPTQLAQEDYRQLLTYITAVGMGVQQQLWDAFKDDTEEVLASTAPQTALSIQKKMLAFQYSATDPQVLVETGANYAYPTTVDAYKVIKYCFAVPGALGVTTIKIADDTTNAMSTPIINAAQGYANVILAPGLKYVISSLNADRLFMEASINYRGEYSAVISANVIAAITTYLQTIPFNGVIDLTDLIVIIRAVPGVIDVLFNNVQARADATAFGSGTNLVFGNTVIQNSFQTIAGKIIPEDTTGQTLADKLTFIPR